MNSVKCVMEGELTKWRNALERSECIRGGGRGAVKYLWDLRVYFYDAGSSRVTVQCGRTTVL